MGIKEKRANYKEEFRREILDSARELFIKDGCEKFSMRKFAEKIGYSPTTIYLYFKNKDELLLAICEEVSEQFLNNIRHIRARQSNPLDALRQALLNFIDFGFDNPNEYKVFFFTTLNVYSEPEEFMGKKSMRRDSYLEFRRLVEDCIEAGKLRRMDIDVLTQVLATAIHGLLAMTTYNSSFPWAERKVLAATLVDGLLRGYRT
ncbi:MAG: TetR/AcrR family transcriptional regulator [Nitrospirae bacterium]|nr:TetR/AcrR family transcriptional regulator [Nitrospirota bacterium]MBF0615904.1 TetR/AcrR family transcriptional regulator [Nitrospirota bacterium]